MGKKTNSEPKAAPAAKSATPPAKGKRGASDSTNPKKKITLAKAATAVAAVAVAAGGALVKKATARKKTPAKRTVTRKASKGASARSFSHEDVALRAYFISERRRIEGLHNDPEQNWLLAEQELHAEFLSKAD